MIPSFALVFLGCAHGPAAPADAPTVASRADPPLAGPDRPFGPPRLADAAPDPLRARPDGASPITLGTPRLPPGHGVLLDPNDFLDELARNAGHVERCWDALPEAPSGSVVVHAHIGPDGAVAGQCITEDTVGDPALQRCVNEAVARGRYPGSAETVDVVFPLEFQGPARQVPPG